MVRLAVLIALVAQTCTMPLQEKYGVHGMITNPNAALTERMRRGALSRSHNTVHRRPGTAEPRPGFRTAYNPGWNVWKMIPFDGDILALGDGGGGVNAEWLNSEDAVTAEGAAPLQWARDYLQGVETRGNLYLTTSDAVRKLTASDDVVAERAHALDAPLVYANATATGSAFADNTHAAYRATISRTDANSVVVASSPSMRAIAENTSGGATAGLIRVLLPVGAAVGDVVRLYRSGVIANTNPPSDDMRAVQEYAIDSSVLALGYVAFTDDLTDTQRGAALYSNPTREGIERSNLPPPLARDLALYKGSLFAARVTYPQFVYASYTEGGDRTGQATGIGTRQIAGTRTNGSANITGVPSIVGLQVGQLVLSSNPLDAWGGLARITAFGGTLGNHTVTVSRTWPSATDGAPASIVFSDSVKVTDGTTTEYYAVDTLPSLLGWVFAGANTIGSSYPASAPYGAARSTIFRVSALNDSLVADDAVAVPGVRRSLRFSSILSSTPALSIAATHGDEYQPALPLISAGADQVFGADAFPNGVAWSKQDEPEHFMLGRYWLVGNKTPVLRIVPAGDYLYIFKAKGDGIYKLSGYGERSGWRVDQVSSDTYLLHPDAVVVHEETVFALTNNGIVAINEAGISSAIDEPIADQTGDLAKDSESFLTVNDDRSFAAFAAYTRDDELVFGLPATVAADDDPAHKVFVYNIENRAWSTWFADDTIRAVAVNPRDQLLYCANDDGEVLGERDRTTDAVITGDRNLAVVITAVDSSTNRITFLPGWVPTVGDLVTQGAVFALVTATDDATHCFLETVSGLAPGGSNVYTAFASVIEWLPHFDPGGALQKRYSALYTHWDDTFGVHRWDIDVSGTGEGDAQAWDDTIDYARTTRKRDTRMLLNADVAFQSQLYTTLTVQQAGSRWRVSGITLEARPAGRRVHH